MALIDKIHAKRVAMFGNLVVSVTVFVKVSEVQPSNSFEQSFENVPSFESCLIIPADCANTSDIIKTEK